MNNFRHSIISILFCLILCTKSEAQGYTVHVEQYGVEEGLLHRNVTTVFESKDGFIWVGSEKGVQRFDGKEFKAWTKKDKTGKIYHISSIGQDDEGWLWLWNNDVKEFIFLHSATEEIMGQHERFGSEFPIQKKENGGWHPPNRTLLTDADGRLCFVISKPNQLIFYSKKNGFEAFPLEQIESDFLELYHLDSHGHFWVTKDRTGSTLYRIDSSGKTLDEYPYIESYDISQFYEKNGILKYRVIGYDDTRFFERRADKHPVELTRKRNQENSVSFNNSFHWEPSSEGLAVSIDENSLPLHSFKKEKYRKSLYENISGIYEDSKGRAWIYSRWGLSKVDIRPNLFTNYFSFEKEADKPMENAIRGIHVEGENVYANIEFGGLVSAGKNTSGNWEIIYQYPGSKTYTGRPLIRLENGEIWNGHGDGTLTSTQFEGENRTIHVNLKGGNPEVNNATWSLYEDDKRRLWAGMRSGLAFKNSNDDFLSPVPDNGALKKEGRLPTIYHISPAPNGNLFLCSDNGLLVFDPDTHRYLARFASDEKGANYLPAISFYFLHTETGGDIWIGTNEGLIKWEPTIDALSNSPYSSAQKKVPYRIFTTLDGLSHDVIYAIYEDEGGHLWLSSDYGIMQFDKASFHVNSFLEKDGISHHEFNRISAFQEKDGTIYFGGLNGITSFHPRDFYEVKNEEKYPLRITSFKIFDREKEELLEKTGELRTSNKIIFKPGDRFFRLKFSLLTYDDVSRILYGWKIVGIDEKWNYQKENSIQFGTLPYGEYVLKIKAKDGHGNWSEDELQIELNIVRPFYLEYWFLIFSGIAFMGGIYFIYKRRTRKLKETQKLLENEITKATSQIRSDKNTIEKQANELRQLDKVKSRFFANMSHELRTPLTLILGPIGSALKSGTLDNRNFTHLKKAQQNGKVLLKLVASILDLSKMESGKLEVHAKPEILFPLVRRIASSFESHAQRSGIAFTFDYQAEKDLQLEIDREKVETILNNLLSNAIKFTPSGGEISVEIKDLENAICLTVADTGRGIHSEDLPHVFDRFYQSVQPDAPTEGGTGIGLALCQELAKVIGGKIWVESELGKGSAFYVELPRREVLGTVNGEQQTADGMQESDLDVLPQVENEGRNFSHPQVMAEPSPTILIVEDNYSLRDYIESILSPCYRIIKAENGQAALEQLNNSKLKTPHLIISDIMMPVMDGFQLLKKLKSDDRYRHLPVIMLTAWADMQDKLRALRIGVDDYLLKPFDEEELLVRIENLLNNQQGRKEFLKENELEETTASISEEDKLWLEKLEAHVQSHLSDTFLSIAQLASEFAMSESTFRRQLKRLTGLSPVKYMQELRLTEARQLLESKTHKSVAKVAEKVGYSDGSTFARLFKKRFGKLPSEY